MKTALESAKRAAEQQPPVIIRKRPRPGHARDAHHSGAWKVAYADFVTAMMAFFLVLWIVSLSDEVKENVAAYFSDPSGFADRVAAQAGDQHRRPSEAMDLSRHLAVIDVEELLRRKAGEVEEALRALPSFEEIEDQVVIEVTEEGLRIQLLESQTTSFFAVGSAVLSPRGVEAISAIGRTIGSLGYDLALEGHTDSLPYAGPGPYTNWELSTDRANSARRVLEGTGVNPASVKSIRGYADTRLRFPNRPDDPRNRRIAILVLNPEFQGE
jgi:chemotaxis protein MotB